MIAIDYDMIVFKEDDTFVAYCPELDVSSCGNTVEQSKDMLKTAVRLFLEEAEKMGRLTISLRSPATGKTPADAGFRRVLSRLSW